MVNNLEKKKKQLRRRRRKRRWWSRWGSLSLCFSLSLALLTGLFGVDDDQN